jgi:isopentenyl diphosphate isomerase/L-lactate dehydrogenase-like FMN-dependent dehydrogenase
VRFALHIVLALAPGAEAAFPGRAMLHALAAGGEEGATRAVGDLGTELVESMRLAGCADRAATRGIACPDRGFSR